MQALQSAGLHQTNYARQIITAIPTAKPTRPDNLTAVQRGLSWAQPNHSVCKRKEK
jgi:hypothetical protein